MSTFNPCSPTMTRRRFLSATAASAATAALAGCVSVPSTQTAYAPARPAPTPSVSEFRVMYGAMVDDGREIPSVPIEKLDPRLYRQEVADPTGEQPGTIVVDTSQHFLYLVRGGGRALRYGVGLGRAGFEWAGRAQINKKRVWPNWHPPEEMIERQPELEKYRTEFDKDTGEWRGGMEGGIMNPLGARALYLYEDGKDTLYRIHGSPEWWTIGKSVSSGCVRMINQDVIDLYDRVPEGTPVVVTSGVYTV
ncbi:L,D-transpeptidase [Chelativorans salis]|uniref:L,D-transpeptidase n=1 Tax=Chelativorans salis TaxID=2978478 RepID=A0ABT2LIH4_9HYPH|nr:L,D-transpeptidase [Chelativorans sp. EGI FJ00035]MCT7373468.1 L,D-transpeptidase [Chelativorans sp. EGI FJ00035]